MSQRVLITAGASGIGRATALAFAARGDRVHVCDVDREALAAFAAAHPEIGTTLCDVAEEAQVAALFAEALARLGGLDVLVNNAGIAGPTAPVEAVDYADWRRCLLVNLDGAFLCARAAAPVLKAQRSGAIVNLSSTAGLYGFRNRTPYCAAKWGVIGLTKTLATELGPFGVRVNAICPGSVEGERMDRVVAAAAAATGATPEAVRAEFVASTAMGCFVRAEDIAATILFLCSPAGERISGQAIPVDGHTISAS